SLHAATREPRDHSNAPHHRGLAPGGRRRGLRACLGERAARLDGRAGRPLHCVLRGVVPGAAPAGGGGRRAPGVVLAPATPRRRAPVVAVPLAAPPRPGTPALAGSRRVAALGGTRRWRPVGRGRWRPRRPRPREPRPPRLPP